MHFHILLSGTEAFPDNGSFWSMNFSHISSIFSIASLTNKINKIKILYKDI